VLEEIPEPGLLQAEDASEWVKEPWKVKLQFPFREACVREGQDFSSDSRRVLQAGTVLFLSVF
jgi:hypothetical protein